MTVGLEAGDHEDLRGLNDAGLTYPEPRRRMRFEFAPAPPVDPTAVAQANASRQTLRGLAYGSSARRQHLRSLLAAAV